MNPKVYFATLFFVWLFVMETDALELFVTPNRTCGRLCTGDIKKPFDNILFAFQNASLAKSPVSIILLGNSSVEHYLLSTEIDEKSLSLLYNIPKRLKLNLEDVEIRPLFCDEAITLNNSSLLNKCLSRNETQTIVFKPIELTLTIMKKLSIKNIIFDWSESSQSVNSTDICAKTRKRCCKIGKNKGQIECDPKFYTKQPANFNNTYNLLELGSDSYNNKVLFFDSVTLKNFRDKTLRSFLQTNGNGSFTLNFQNSVVDEVSFGTGLVNHVGDGKETLSSSINFINVSFTKYNYWNREEEIAFRDWKEGYLLLANTNFKGRISVENSNFVDFNTASMYTCDTNSSSSSNYLLDYAGPRTNIWNRHYTRNFTRESSVIFISRLDGGLRIKNSTFKKIIGLYGAVVQVKDCSSSTIFIFTDSKFDDNFGMQGFANILIVTVPKATIEAAKCPSIRVENCEFTNSKGCPGSYGNTGFICYWDTIPSYKTPLLNAARVYIAYLLKQDGLFQSPQIQISYSKFRNNLIPISNSIVIIGSYFSYLNDNKFEDNGGTTAEIILYSLNNSNFLEKKPNQYYNQDYNWQSYYSSCYFGQSSVVFFDRIFKLESIGNTFKGNWGPWEGSQVLGTAITIRAWIPARSYSLKFQDNIFSNHMGIPAHIGEYLVKYGISLKNNSFMPPLITASFDPKDASRFENKVNQSFILFDGVEFKDNTFSYDLTQGCKYNSVQLQQICSIMKDKRRYLTGFIKFLSESEFREESLISFLSISQQDKMSFSMTNSKIINNTLLSEGCLFSTLWAENYIVDNITIQDNKINPSGNYFTESANYSKPLLDLPLENRNGIFCAFKKETIKGFINGILFTASNLRAMNNIGTIFNLYPYESSNFSLINSLLLNNTVPYGSMVNIFDISKAISMNNIFVENNNSLGIFFLDSQYVSHNSAFNTYLQNNGKHASLAYINNKAQMTEALAKHYWNDIKPTFLTFRDQVTPQGGLYFIESSQLSFTLSEFKYNLAYAGFIIAFKSFLSFDLTNINDHNISGNSIIGNIYSSVLSMRQMQITNNSLNYLPSFHNALSIIILEKVKLTAENLEITGSLTNKQEIFLLGTKIEGTLKNIKFENFHSQAGSLIRLEFSEMKITNLSCYDITSLFKLLETKLTLRFVSIRNLIMLPSLKFLINMIDTTLDISQFEYLGGFENGDYSSLIAGINSNIKVIESKFSNAVKGLSKVFELTNCEIVFFSRNIFEYNEDYTKTIIFDLSSNNEVKILECVFILSGQIIQAYNIFTDFYFTENTILTNSHQKNFKLIGSNLTTFSHNHFLLQNKQEINLLPDSQVHFLETIGFTSIKDNLFISLYGSKGIIEFQAFTNPYNINSTRNSFINNTGSLGGALYLAASFSSSTYTTPVANIEYSVFVLNKAINFQEQKGKGGAIFQTTSNSIYQATRIKHSLFIKNSAENIGGALFFDYLPLQVDNQTKFRDNYAERTNHIGSYPVGLAFYEQEPQEMEPYLPNQPFPQESLLWDSQTLLKWENIPSGLTVNRTYFFALVDIFGQIVYDDNSSSLELYPEGLNEDAKPFFSSILSVEARNGLYILSNLKFSYNIDEYVNLTLVSSAIQDQRNIPLDIPIISSSSLKIQIHFRKCGRGEIVIKDENAIICKECQSSLWQISNQPNALSCKPCDDKSTICLGGDNVGPKKGYWRFNETADIVLPCPIDSSCLGNEITNQKESILLDPVGKCEYGYKGNLCSNCISGWAKTPTGACTPCEKNFWFYTRLIMTLAIQLVLIIQGFRETMNLSKNYSENKPDNLNGAILIRILTNYLQLISVVSAIPITWPTLIKNLSAIIFEMISIKKNVISANCIFTSEEVYGTKVVFVELLLEVIGGFILAFLSVVFWIIYFQIRRRKILRSKRFINNVITTIVVICYLMQPSAIRSSFSFLQCTNLYREDTPIKYFSKDYDVICWEGQHLYWALGLGLPSLVIWSFFLPFIAFNQIRKKKDKLTSPEISKKYAFLYGGYNPSKYYWEFIIVIRKLIFISAIIGVSFYSTNLEIYVSIFLVGLFYFINSINNPFSSPQINLLEKLSLLSAITINFCGIFLNFSDQSQTY